MVYWLERLRAAGTRSGHERRTNGEATRRDSAAPAELSPNLVVCICTDGESGAVRVLAAFGDVQECGGQPLLAVRSSQMIRGRTLRSAACS